MIGIGIIVTFAVFWILEIVAHFTHYRYGPTLSARIWRLEQRYHWTRLIVFGLVVILGTHLELHIP